MDKKGYNTGNNNTPPSLADYENSAAKGESLYLDSGEFADIISYYSSIGKYKEGLTAVKEALHIHPDNSDILLEKAYIHLYQSNFGDARQLATYLSGGHDTNDVLLLKVEIDLHDPQIEDKNSIIVYLNQLEQKNNIDTIIDVCYVLLDSEQILQDLLTEWIDKGLRLFPHDVSFLQAYAEYLKRTSQFDIALRVIEKLIDSDPYNTSYWWARSIINFELQRFDECKESLEFTIVTDENFGDAYFLMGQLHLLNQNFKEATIQFHIAIEKGCSDLSSTYMALANCYLELDDNLYNKYFLLAIHEGADEDELHKGYIDTQSLSKVIDNLTNEEQLKLISEIRFNKVAEERLLNSDAGLSTEIDINGKTDIKSVLEQLNTNIDFIDNSYNENSHLIYAILNLEDGDTDGAIEEAYLAEESSTSIYAYYELAKVFIELSDLTKAKRYFKKTYDLESTFNQVGFDLAVIALIEGNEMEFNQYNENLDIKIDFSSPLSVLNDLDSIDKSYLKETIKHFLIKQ